MKTAKAFLITMYLHLVLSVATPVVVVVSGQYRQLEQLGFALFVIYMAELVLLPVLGFVTAGAGIAHCRRGEGAQLEKGWLLLKFGSVPFTCSISWCAAWQWSCSSAPPGASWSSCCPSRWGTPACSSPNPAAWGPACSICCASRRRSPRPYTTCSSSSPSWILSAALCSSKSTATQRKKRKAARNMAMDMNINSMPRQSPAKKLGFFAAKGLKRKIKSDIIW